MSCGCSNRGLLGGLLRKNIVGGSDKATGAR